MSHKRPLGVGLLVLVTFVTVAPVEAAKNVILMVADGAGYNTWLAASMYQGRMGQQVYDQPGWVRLSCTTYPMNLSHKPTGNSEQNPAVVYDPIKAWDATPGKSLLTSFVGYGYLKVTPTDSAAAATALASGQRTYNNAINWSNGNRPMTGQTIAELAKVQGKRVGVITSVQWSHATPAGLGGAHNVSRDNYSHIAKEMLTATWLDVIMGAGNPDFDDNGQPLPEAMKREYKWVGDQQTWESLKTDRLPWKLIESCGDFEKLASGATPAKVLGTAQAASTLQQKRGKGLVTIARNKLAPPAAPYAMPRNQNVPSLAAMSRAAINCLDDEPQGFFLMIEGGAVDWANHENEPGRLIEEQIDFLQAVDAVVAWVEKHSSWDETLLILTADHECGLLWGPDSAKVAFQPLVDHGKGKLPGMRHNAFGHSNSLVPLYARGAGATRFNASVRGRDPKAAEVWKISGQYIDNTDVFRVMRAEVEQKAE